MRLFIITFQALVLISMFSACLQKEAKQHSEVQSTVRKTISTVESEIDTAQHLTYTSMVRAILEDSKGNFWFGSEEGVCRYDGSIFTYFTEQDGLSDNQIRSIQEDKQGTIWIGTGNGISSYDGKDFSTHKYQSPMGPASNPETDWKHSGTSVWLGDGDRTGGLFRVNSPNLSSLKFPVLDSDHESFSITGPVTGICKGNNRIWIASYGGVLGYNGNSFKFINERDIAYHVRSIHEDSKGNLWIGNNGIGVLYYDGVTTVNFTEKYGLNDPKSIRGGIRSPKGTLNHVFAIGEDHDGTMWFGDRDTGAWSFDGSSLTNYNTEHGLTSMFVRAIYTAKNGDVLIGMDDGAVCKFNGEAFVRIYN